jgi:adenine-specific DNA-methyltransferase
MYPRLFLARNLLREDGVIFVSIDDNEVHNLRLLMNEVFGEDNFVAQFVWQKKYSRDNRPLIGTTHEYIVMYAINIEYFANVRNLLPPSEESLKVYKNPNNDPRGRWRPIPMTAQAGHATPSQFYEITTPTGVIHKPPVGRCWAITKKKYEQLLKEGRIYFGKGNSSQPNIIRYIDEIDGFVPWTWLPSSELGHTDSAMKEFYSIMGKEAAFETPKPSTLMKHFIKIASNNNDLILDFFAGTSTTAHAVLDLNKEDGASRKFIVVQLPEKCDESSDAYKAGYETIAEIGKERIRRVIKKIQDTEQQTKLDVDGATGKQDLGFKVFKLQQSNFKIWRSDVKTEEELYTQLTLHTDPVDENAKIENILYELLLKSGVPLTARIKKKDGYYLINKDEIALILKKIDESIIKAVISEKPKKFITLDRLFKNNDQLKTNTALQMKDVGIEFKAV